MVIATSPAIYLVALACPLSMGLMMWFMSKGMMGGTRRDDASGDARKDEKALADLRAEQARLAEKIAGLESKERDDLSQPLPSSNGQEAQQAERATQS